MPLTPREGKQAELMALLLDNLERAEALCAKHDYRLHVENVYHRLGFYRRLFEGVVGRRLSRIHFCFDIGHAKVWSRETLDDWLRTSSMNWRGRASGCTSICTPTRA